MTGRKYTSLLLVTALVCGRIVEESRSTQYLLVMKLNMHLPFGQGLERGDRRLAGSGHDL